MRICRDVALTPGSGASTVIGTKRRTTPDLASFANGAAFRYYDLNDAYTGRTMWVSCSASSTWTLRDDHYGSNLTLQLAAVLRDAVRRRAEAVRAKRWALGNTA